MRFPGSILLVLPCAIIVAACGNDVRDMTYEEIQALPASEQRKLSEDLTMQEMKQMMRTAIRHRGDTNELKTMTIGKMIEEGAE